MPNCAIDFQNGNGSAGSLTNPVAKPPRVTDLQQFNTTGQLASNGSLTINGTVFHPPENGKAIGNSSSNPGNYFETGCLKKYIFGRAAVAQR
jgi:hypothetical protein